MSRLSTLPACHLPRLGHWSTYKPRHRAAHDQSLELLHPPWLSARRFPATNIQLTQTSSLLTLLKRLRDHARTSGDTQDEPRCRRPDMLPPPPPCASPGDGWEVGRLGRPVASRLSTSSCCERLRRRLLAAGAGSCREAQRSRLAERGSCARGSSREARKGRPCAGCRQPDHAGLHVILHSPQTGCCGVPAWRLHLAAATRPVSSHCSCSWPLPGQAPAHAGPSRRPHRCRAGPRLPEAAAAAAASRRATGLTCQTARAPGAGARTSTRWRRPWPGLPGLPQRWPPTAPAWRAAASAAQ